VHTFEGKPYMNVNGTGMVWVGVTMGGNSRTCWLPVMNHRNQPDPWPGCVPSQHRHQRVA
jgi:hypothetical protein